MTKRTRDRRTAREMPEMRREEAILLTPQELVSSLKGQNERSLLLTQRMIVRGFFAILVLSVLWIWAFLAQDTGKKPVHRVISLIASTAMAVWAAGAVYQFKRTAVKAQELITEGSARLPTAKDGPEHELESTVLLRALEIFGDSGRALKWMRENNPALNGDTPLHAIQSEDGRREVLNVLGRIEYGVIS